MTPEERSDQSSLMVLILLAILTFGAVVAPFICFGIASTRYREGDVPKGRLWVAAGLAVIALDVLLVMAFVAWMANP